MGLKEDMSRHLGCLGRKTSAMLEEARLRGRIGSLENEIKGLYATVGKTMFAMWMRQDVDTGRLVKYFEAVRRKQEEIDEKKELILQAKARGAGKTPEEAAEAAEKPDRSPLPDCGGRIAGVSGDPAEVTPDKREPERRETEAQKPEEQGAEAHVPDRQEAEGQVPVGQGAEAQVPVGQEAEGQVPEAQVPEEQGAEAQVPKEKKAAPASCGAVTADDVVIEEDDEGVGFWDGRVFAEQATAFMPRNGSTQIR